MGDRERDGKPDRGANAVVGVDHLLAGGDLIVGNAPEEFLDSQAQLKTGQVRAQAAMRPGRESDVRVVRPREVDRLRVVEGVRVRVRRRLDHLDLGPGREVAAADVDVLGHPPVPERHG